MKYYPVFLNVKDRSCVVVGGGEVGERKVFRLLRSEAWVTVVSPELTPTLEALYESEQIQVHRASYDRRFITNAFLVIGATNRPEINDHIYRDCHEQGILVNIVDDPERCDFILPAVVEQGDLSVAISTNGKSPALARKIRQDLSQHFGPEYGTLLSVLAKIRSLYRRSGKEIAPTSEIYARILATSILEDIRERRWDRIETIIKEHAGLDITFHDEVRRP